MKINQQAQVSPAQSQIRCELSFMNWQKNFTGFQFNYHLIVNQHVKPIAEINPDALERHRQRNLTPEVVLPSLQFVSQASFVSALQQAWSKQCVNFDGGADDVVGNLIELSSLLVG